MKQLRPDGRETAPHTSKKVCAVCCVLCVVCCVLCAECCVLSAEC